jgi:hypothetical protein
MSRRNSGRWEQWWPLTCSLKQDMPDKATEGQWEERRRLAVKALGVNALGVIKVSRITLTPHTYTD